MLSSFTTEDQPDWTDFSDCVVRGAIKTNFRFDVSTEVWFKLDF